MKKVISKDTIVKNTFTIIALVLILIIEGCFNFLTFKWNWDILLTIVFWVGVATRIMLQMLTRSAAMNTFIPVAREKNADLKNETSKNERLTKLKDKEFPSWVENVLNRDIRKETWIVQENKKLSKLEKHAKYKDRALWLMEDTRVLKVKKNKNGEDIQITALDMKKKNHYCKKKKEYLELLEEGYIKENVDNLPLRRCPHVDAALFDIPVTNVSNTDRYQLVARTKQAIMWTLVVAGISLTISTTIKNALQFGYSSESLITALVSMLIDLFFLCWQFVQGVSNAYKIINDQEVVPYVNRNRILTQYMYYKTPEAEKDKLKMLLDKMEAPKKEPDPKQEEAKAIGEVVNKVASKVVPYITP